MKNYWVSWVNRYGPFDLHSPWWISGYHYDEDGHPTICAAIKAESDYGAKEKIRCSFDVIDREMKFRFCTEKPNDWEPFSDRFPRADWMKWGN